MGLMRRKRLNLAVNLAVSSTTRNAVQNDLAHFALKRAIIASIPREKEKERAIG